MRVTPTPFAASQIREHSRWWRINRTKAPRLFREELRRVFRLIAAYPEAGAIAEHVELAGVRRVLLAATQHYLYYRMNEGTRRSKCWRFGARVAVKRLHLVRPPTE